MKLLVLLPTIYSSLANAICYEPIEAHPLPKYDIHDPILKSTFARIETALKDAVADPQYDATAFSVEITSSEETLYSQYHTARHRNASRPDIGFLFWECRYFQSAQGRSVPLGLARPERQARRPFGNFSHKMCREARLLHRKLFL